MSRRLTLLRHAHAAASGTGMSDFDRPLDALGQEQAAEAARQLRIQAGRPDRMLVSAARRTMETAERLRQDLELDADSIEHSRDLYLASSQVLLRRVRAVPDTVQHLLIVGHNPGISDLIDQLHGQTSGGLPTAGFANFQVDGAWRTLESAELVGLWD